MRSKVELANAVFYDVSEIRVEHDSEGDPVVYITLLYRDPKNPYGLPMWGSKITCFPPGDEIPAVYVDGKKIVNPVKEPEEAEAE